MCLAVAAIAGCSSSDTGTPTGASTGSSLPSATTPAPATQPTASTQPAGTVAAGGGLDGAHVQVVGLWSGPELDSFTTVASTWEHDTGAVVDWQGSDDLAGTIDAAFAAGTPPDIAILPNVGLLHELAAAGRLVPLASVLDAAQLEADYAPAWLELGSHDDQLYGVFAKVTDKSTVWYSPAAFAADGYAVPTTWDEMITLADQMVAEGRTPFSVVAPQSPAAGWALTDWVSLLVLGGCGPDVYDRWVTGDVPWTDPCIEQSFQRFVTVVQTPGDVLGGAPGILSTTDAAGSYPMYRDPPTAYMYVMSSFAQAFIAAEYPELAAGEDYDAFPFPTVDPAHAGSVMIGGDIVVMVHDTPAARAFLAYLTGADAQRAWVALGGFTSVNRGVGADAYPDPVARATAERLSSAAAVRYSAGDTMPFAVQRAWWAAMVQLVQDPTALDGILADMTTAAEAAAAGG